MELEASVHHRARRGPAVSPLTASGRLRVARFRCRMRRQHPKGDANAVRRLGAIKDGLPWTHRVFRIQQ